MNPGTAFATVDVMLKASFRFSEPDWGKLQMQSRRDFGFLRILTVLFFFVQRLFQSDMKKNEDVESPLLLSLHSLSVMLQASFWFSEPGWRRLARITKRTIIL